MVERPAAFAWYELLTTDMAAAKAFYGSVVGWGVQDAATPQFAYNIFTVGKAPVCGLMDLPDDARKKGATPRWVGYVAVDDVDGVVDRLRRLGGTVYVPPTDSNIGRIAVVADPQTATLAMVDGLKAGGQVVELDRVGRVGWHELFASDAKTAWAFYRELFGWEKAEAEAGPMESYQLFSTGGQTAGGIFTKLPRAPVPFWLYYFNVADLGVALQRVKTAGGQVLQGPVEMPDGSWIARCVDPQGAMFALQGHRSEADTEPVPTPELRWSAEWGDFTSTGRVLANPASGPTTQSKPKTGR